MALQLRRGPNAQRATTQFAAGELVYVTDNVSTQVSPLYIGDGSTTGGVPVITSKVNSGTVNALAYYAAAGTAVSNTVSLAWDETTNNLTISLGSLTVTAGNTGRSLADFNTSADSPVSNVIGFNKSRGQPTARTAVINGDIIGMFRFSGYDGAANIRAAAITTTIEGTVSTGVVPGALSFAVTNLSGVSAIVVKINNATTGSNGLLAVTGTVKASVALQTAVFADNAARNLTIPVPAVGMIIFNTATGKFEGNTDGTTGGWVALN